MTANKLRDETIQGFLSKSADDLASAKVLYDTKHFSNSLYFLQQSSEKLSKALWLRMGILTPKKARENGLVKSVLGFQPKEPIRYGHRILPHLVSDLDRMVPSMQKLIDLMENSELKPRVSEFLAAFGRSRKSVKKLKKKPFTPVGSTEQLEKEVKAINAILDALDPTIEKIKGELAKLETRDVAHAATGLMRQLGFRVDLSQVLSEMPSLEKIRSQIVEVFRISVLSVMSTATASLLDPLESAARYPDPQRSPFDENHPYIKNFMGLHDVIAYTLQKSRTEAPTRDAPKRAPDLG